MMQKSTVFIVTDIETTLKKRIAFDVAWQAVDRAGRVYGSGSYVIRDAFKMDVPYFKEKLGHYFDDAYSHLIKPASILEVRHEYNSLIDTLKDKGHEVILCAYNAAFDFKYLPHTLQVLEDDAGASWLNAPCRLLDIWHYWANSVPLHYTAERTPAGNFRTTAEAAFRFETGQPDFVERHIAWHDVEIEKQILAAAIRRKKKMPLVSHPGAFVKHVWRIVKERVGTV
jgi:hypothetical protein